MKLFFVCGLLVYSFLRCQMVCFTNSTVVQNFQVVWFNWTLKVWPVTNFLLSFFFHFISFTKIQINCENQKYKLTYLFKKHLLLADVIDEKVCWCLYSEKGNCLDDVEAALQKSPYFPMGRTSKVNKVWGGGGGGGPKTLASLNIKFLVLHFC